MEIQVPAHHLPAAVISRILNLDFHIEAARSPQSCVQGFRHVRGGQYKYIASLLKAVHLIQQLNQRAVIGKPFPAFPDGIDLVNKDDHLIVFLGCGKQCLDQFRRIQIGPRHFNKGNVFPIALGFFDGLHNRAGHTPGEEALAGAGGTLHQRALGNGAAGIRLRIADHLHHLLQLLRGAFRSDVILVDSFTDIGVDHEGEASKILFHHLLVLCADFLFLLLNENGQLACCQRPAIQ